MASHEIRLQSQLWTFDDAAPLGPPGGFGQVFRGNGLEGEVAVKMLHLEAGNAAHRELAVNKRLMSRNLRHVLPILDLGQDANSERYFIVMPICDGDLSARLGPDAASYELIREVGMQVLAGLDEVPDLVHRDLKPGNILWLEDRWVIADFGIAKFVEDTTSLDTLRGCLTPQFGAPEQWRIERPSSATDVYSLGCVLYAMAAGSPPFSGDTAEIRRGHLTETPGVLEGVPPRIAALVAHMLRKPPEARPDRPRCIRVLADTPVAVSGGGGLARQALVQAGLEVATEEATREAARLAEEERAAARARLGEDGVRDLRRITERIRREIEAHAEGVKRRGENLFLGRAGWLWDDAPVPSDRDLRHSGWSVAAFARTRLIQDGGLAREDVWPVTFIFGSRGGEQFRWYEINFFSQGDRRGPEPFSLAFWDQDFDLALSRVAHTTSAAWGPNPIDAENEDEFVERWITLFARAAAGRWRKPDWLPVTWPFFID